MNALQMHYLKDVLGVNSVVQPESVRSVYRIHKHVQAPAFLFFLTHWKVNQALTLSQGQQKTTQKDEEQWKKGKYLIQKINQSLNASCPEWIIEVLDLENHQTHLILEQLLVRLLPKGFIVFDPHLAKRLLKEKYTSSPTGEIKYPISWGKTQQIVIPACVLNPISDFLDTTDKIGTQRIKRQAWEKLQRVFSVKN